MLVTVVASVMSVGEDELFKALLLGKETALQDGRTYIVKERKPKRARDRFDRLLAQGYRGLYITRQHPDNVGKAKLPNVRLIWLSTTLGTDYMDPHNLGSLTSLIRSSVEQPGPLVILLDGLEYLMINNEFPRILNFMELLNEIVSQRQAILLFSVDDRAFEERELALLERNAIPLE